MEGGTHPTTDPPGQQQGSYSTDLHQQRGTQWVHHLTSLEQQYTYPTPTAEAADPHASTLARFLVVPPTSKGY